MSYSKNPIERIKRDAVLRRSQSVSTSDTEEEIKQANGQSKNNQLP